MTRLRCRSVEVGSGRWDGPALDSLRQAESVEGGRERGHRDRETLSAERLANVSVDLAPGGARRLDRVAAAGGQLDGPPPPIDRIRGRLQVAEGGELLDRFRHGLLGDAELVGDLRRRGRPDQVFEVHEILVAGERAAVRATWRGVVGVEAGPFRAGQELVAQVAALLTVRNGTVVDHETFDCYERLEQ